MFPSSASRALAYTLVLAAPTLCFGKTPEPPPSDFAKSTIKEMIKDLTRMDCRPESNVTTMCEEILPYAEWPACGAQYSAGEDCTVYSFGVADDWDFEYAAGDMGCKVYAFDPTTNYVKNLDKNVDFYCIGLGGKTDGGTDLGAFNHKKMYGAVMGPIIGLLDIKTQVIGQELDAPISILKIDCEGCEWPALAYIADYHPELLDSIQQINIEMHYGRRLQVRTRTDLENMAKAYHLLKEKGFKIWYSYPQSGHDRDKVMMPELLELGFPKEFCCYEVGMTKFGTNKLERPALQPAHWKQRHQVTGIGQVCANEGVQYLTHPQLSRVKKGEKRYEGHTTKGLVKKKLQRGRCKGSYKLVDNSELEPQFRTRANGGTSGGGYSTGALPNAGGYANEGTPQGGYPNEGTPQVEFPTGGNPDGGIQLSNFLG